ncbi:MAG: TnsA endonuclease N-terminal domain-containing protein [Thermodesulfovibrionales bacterium]|nr:TnsA endonuclease N-terminal domain-containing protein [Nitrospinota bacterium]MCG2709149.1 TnsA endonuclease N-terminal domain-containing protein [Thermodesulfovibrionales bacterium]
MPVNTHYGDFEGPKKSPYSIERYDYGWELEHMRFLEKDKMVSKWTKNHGIEIPYVTESGNIRKYRPDFLIQRIDGTKEIHEVKGRHLLENPDTLRKREAAENWCKRRGMQFILVSKETR